MNGMFSGAESFNQDLSEWNVRQVTNMVNMFSFAKTFDQDLSKWNVDKVTNMEMMFSGATSFQQVLCSAQWIDSLATKANMFRDSPGSIERRVCFSPQIRGDLKSAVDACLKLSPVGDCSTVPYGPIGLWDVSQVKNMDTTFSDAKSFNQDLSKWNVGKVTSMQGMFYQASVFNGDLSGWNVRKVTIMQGMFSDAGAFNQDLSKWNVAQVTDTSFMFCQASAFNQDLSNWNVDKVTNMELMFDGAKSFKQTLCGEAWVKSKANKADMLTDSPGSISCDRFQPQNSEDLKTAVDTCRDR